MRYFGLALTLAVLVPGCVRVEYCAYRGRQDWPTGSAFVGRVEGIEVFEGLPQRPYEVIGLVDVYADEPFVDHHATKKVLEYVKNKDADALIWLSDRVVSSGSLRMESETKDPASIDTGRSSQPEMVITNVNQYVQTSRTERLRSTLLLIRWKGG